MATALVFVDDAVLGRLPPVCAKDGVPTTDRLRVRSGVGGTTGLGVAWLLVLAGPLGWLGLLLISTSRSRASEEITVEIPMSEPAYQRMKDAQRRRRNASLAAVLAAAAALWILARSSGLPETSSALRLVVVLCAIAGAVAVVAALVADRKVAAAMVPVSLDGTRRWVTLSNVHPSFAEACSDQLQRDRDLT